MAIACELEQTSLTLPSLRFSVSGRAAMIRWMIVLATAGVAGAAAGFWITARDTDAPAVGAAVRQDARLSGSTASQGAREADRRPSRNSTAERPREVETTERIEDADQLSSTFARGEALHSIAARADERRVRELIIQAEALENESDRLAALELLLLRLAELDPEVALQRALESDPRNVAQLVTALSVRAPAQTWKLVSKVADPLARMDYQAAVSTAWIAQDPQKAFTSVAELPSSWSREQLLRYVTRNIARRDPQGAIELIATIEHDPDANALLEAIAEQWGRSDPSAAAQWVETAETGTRQGRLAYQIADAYVMQKPQEALAWALRISRSPARYLWSHMIGQIAIDNPQEALRLAQGAENPTQRTQALAEALTTIAARDPALAMSQLQKLPAGEARTQVASQVALQIAQTRPAAAIEWLERLDDGRMRYEVARQIASTLADADADAAAELVDRVPKEARYAWILSVALAYANSDLDKGVQWVGKYRDEPGDIVFQFARKVAARSPDVALSVVERLAEDKQREQMLTAMLPVIAQHSPETAARSLDKVSDRNARARAASEITNVWVRYDEPAAQKWVHSLESGVVRDSALSALATHAGSMDDRLSLIREIQSPDQRMNTVMNVAMRLALADPEGVRTLLRRYPLDPQRQQQVDAMAQKRTRGW
jgi:hypothetical protein